LLDYVKEVAIPQILVSDGSKEQTASKFADTCKRYFWRKAIEKELATVMVAFMFMNNDWDPKTGPDGVYQFVKCHMVFDIEMDLTRKATLPKI
jgi:hypothetical protein